DNQANVRALANGQVAPDAFAYTVSDGQTYTQTTTQTIENLIPQSEAFNDASWVSTLPAGIPSTPPALNLPLTISSNVGPGPMGGANTADQVNLMGPSAAIYYKTNVSGQYTFSVWVRLISGAEDFSLGYYDASTNTIVYQAALATSNWQRISITFSGDGSANSWVGVLHSPYQAANGVLELWGAQLNGGAAPEPYLATTGTPATTTTSTTTSVGATLTVNVTGDTPVGTPDSAAVSVGGTQVATGNVLSNDTAPHGLPLSIVAVNGTTVSASGTTTIAGIYGMLVIQANGQYTYTLTNSQANVQALVGGQTVADSFSYTLSDGQVYTQVTSKIDQNLIVQSEAFNSASWVTFASSGTLPTIVANVAPGPNGGASTADEVTLAGANSGICYQTNVPGQYIFSVWVRLISGDGDFSFNYYSGSLGVNYIQSTVATSAWQRLTFAFSGDGSAYSNVALMHGPSQSTSGTFEFWGAQLNPGTVADNYVPTTGSPATVTTSVTSTPTIGSALTVSVSGSDTGKLGPALDFQNSTQAVVADLATGQWSYALNVMPLGDSITYGWNAQNLQTQNNLSEGYRGPLWSDFVNNNMLVNLVGDHNDGPPTLLDQANAGYPGLMTNQIAVRLPGLLAAEHPNAILLMAGTNDIFEGVAPSTISANILGMLNTVASFSPSIHVYVATLLPMANSFSADVAPVDTAITSMVQQAQASGLNVSLVNMSNFTTADLSSDGTHPSATGYALMAQDWHSAILAQQPANGGTPGGIANQISSSIYNLVGGSGNALLIGNTQPNIISAGSGNDVLVGGGGNDTLIGGAGAAEFVITPAAGTITIQDFMPSAGDMLVFDGISGLTSAATLSGHVTQSGGQTNIDLTSFGTNLHVVIQNYTGDLSQSQFI
ncbi:MAG TPA: GDSL-type esterase/lipase family protein, partial [Acetobacteraceae bacterium]|nr:GDSL-type esterase/lipase family protein [Acetobacteraceae bacterium]